MDKSETNQPENIQPTQTNQDYTTYTDFTVTRLSCTPSEQKTIPGTGPQAKPPSPPQYYYQIPLMYNFGTQETRILNDFLFEACEMDTQFGIQSKPGQSGRLEHSIMCRFDANNQEHNKFIESMGQVHAGCAYILSQMKGAVKLYNFDPKIAEATGLKNPVYRARDEVTGEVIQGRSPSMFLKLFSRGKAPMTEQTLFTGIDGKPIQWNLLQAVEMKFIPLLHVKRIYVGGGKASIQMEVISAVVTSIRARNTTSRQLGTIQRLQHDRPELLDIVAGQLAKLTIDRQDQLMNVPTMHSNSSQHDGHDSQHDGNDSQHDGQPTYEGITPTNHRQPNSSGILPNIPQRSMQDFTSAAPIRSTLPISSSINTQEKQNSPSSSNILKLN